MLRKCLFFLLYVGFNSCFGYTQNSKLIFSAKDNLKFKILINNLAQHNNFTSELAIIRIDDSQNYSLHILIENDSVGYKQLVSVFDENVTQFYEVTTEKIVLLKIITGTYTLKKSENRTIVPYTKIGFPNKDTLVVQKDTVAIDTTYKIPFESYYKMPDYEGKIGCPWPIKNENANKILLQLQQLNLDGRKFE